jgi:hypothetical protein
MRLARHHNVLALKSRRRLLLPHDPLLTRPFGPAPAPGANLAHQLLLAPTPTINLRIKETSTNNSLTIEIEEINRDEEGTDGGDGVDGGAEGEEAGGDDGQELGQGGQD